MTRVSGSSTTRSGGSRFALNIGLENARGEFVARMDAHTLYPPDYLARGVERLRRGDVAWVSGPQLPRRDRQVVSSDRARPGHPARDRRRGVSQRAPRARGRRRLHGRVAAGDPAEAWGLGPGVADQRGRRARSAHSGGRRADRLHPGDGRAVRAPRQPAGARPPVLALRQLPGEDLPRPPREHAALASAPACARDRRAARARAGGAGSAGWRESGWRPTPRPCWPPRPPGSGPGSAMRARCRRSWRRCT